MASAQPTLHRDVLVALRRIIRAIDLHSRALAQRFGLTGPQLVILEELARRGATPIGAVADAISLSVATVTGILSRLEARGLVERRRDDQDRRKVFVSVTPAGAELLEEAPPALQESFMAAFERLQDWEQTLILSSLQRVVAMMEATALEATPMLATGSIDETQESDSEGDLASS